MPIGLGELGIEQRLGPLDIQIVCEVYDVRCERPFDASLIEAKIEVAERDRMSMHLGNKERENQETREMGDGA